MSQLYAKPDSFVVELKETGELTFAVPRPFEAQPSVGEFPLSLCFAVHPALWSTGAVSEREELLRREVNQSVVYLSPGDLARLKIKPGFAVQVVTPHGAARMTAQEDKRLAANVLLAVPLPASEARALGGFLPNAKFQSFEIQPVPARLEAI